MEYDIYTVSTSDYKNNFWNKVMRGQPNSTELINKGSVGGNMYAIPYDSNKKYMYALKNECIFRQIATSIKTKDSDLDIWASDSEDPAEWAPSNSYQTIKEVADVFTKKRVKCHKLAIIDRMDMDFMQVPPSRKNRQKKACKNRMDLRITAGCSCDILPLQLPGILHRG